jgi:ankyrin repeat protein
MKGIPYKSFLTYGNGLMKPPSPSSSSSSTPLSPSSAASVHSGKVAFNTVARAQLIHTLSDQQPDCEMLNALPVELLFYILQQMQGSATLFKLSISCRGFKAMVEEIYKDQYKQFIKEHPLPVTEYLAACQVGIPTCVETPMPRTDEWEKLRYYKERQFTGEGQIKEIYITAWDLLLQPVIREDKECAFKLMRMLLDLVSHINNVEAYTAALFPGNFPAVLFDQLAHVHLDWCLQLIITHFPIVEDSPAYQFIVDQCPVDAINIENIEEIQQSPYLSFLFKAVEDLFLFEEEEENKESRYFAAQSVAWIECLLQQGTDCNATDEGGKTLLMLACMNKSIRLVSLLCQQPNLDINRRDEKYGNTALEYAITADNLSIVQRLLNHSNIEINAEDELGLRPLNYAIGHSNLAIIQAMLRHPHIEVNHLPSPELKLSALPMKNRRNNPYLGPLYYAIEHAELSCLDKLLTLTVDLDTRLYAFLYALWKGEETIALSFLPLNEQKKGFVTQALKLAQEAYGKANYHTLLKPLLGMGADCNIKYEGNITLLMGACKDQQAKVITLLLQYPEIEVNARNDYGNSALDYAVRSSNVEVVQALLTHGVNADIRLCAFNYAMQQGNEAILNTFLQPMPAQERDDFIHQAVAHALRNSQPEVVEVLRHRYCLTDTLTASSS